MMKQAKKIWDGSIEHTVTRSIGGGLLRTANQPLARNVIANLITVANITAFRRVMEDVDEIVQNYLWSDIDIKVTIEIIPQKNTEEQ